MTKTQLDELRRQAEDEYRKNLDAIERVSRMMPVEAAAIGSPTSQPRKPKTHRFGRGELKKEILAFADKGSNFSIGDLMAHFQKDGGKVALGSVKQALGSLRESKGLVVVQQGIGRRPTVYTKGKD